VTGSDRTEDVIGPSRVAVPRRATTQLEPVIGAQRYHRLVSTAASVRARLAGRTVWNVNSTAVGGGVAEMLQALIGYIDDLGINVRWMVIDGDTEFFAVTKRLHNRIHGQAGDSGDLGAPEAAHYTEVLAANARGLVREMSPGDLVVLHDPQTAGLVAPLVRAGVRVVWRCHIGTDRHNGVTGSAWRFLRPHLADADGYVFSRRQYVPSWLPDARTWIVPPSIDPFATKNQPMSEATVQAVLARIGVLDGVPSDGPCRFVRLDGTEGEVTGKASVVAEALPGPSDRFVLQVSRWDRLKDMAGVMRGFAEHVAPAGPWYLVLAGPAVAEVSDDPEGAAVYQECVAQWHALPAAVRRRVLLVTLPLDDIDENAAMVNALQRQAAVIAQKSLAEGFGLTVAEGMWKGRPTAGSAVGGIQDQIVDGTGILLPDPTDLAGFGAAVRDLLVRPDLAADMGAAAHAHVAANFLGDRHLLRYAAVFESLVAA
jgi:trehalose synthase